MNDDTKILLDIYKNEFKNYKIFLDNNEWIEDITYNSKSNKLESNKLNTEISIIDTIVKSTDKFKSDIGEDINKKPVKDFIKTVVTIINNHIKGIEQYKKTHPLTEDSLEHDVKFHSDLFALIAKTKVNLSKLKIDENELAKKSVDLFYGNGKAPLLMREFLSETIPIIKDKTDLLDIDFSSAHINPATSNEMFINMKPRDIPKWDETKHFFEQEKSTIQFWEEEFKKIKNGVNLNGYYMSPWLYWHINHFKLSYIDEFGTKGTFQPQLRDNEYYFDQMYKKAQDHGRCGLFLYGTRRFSKSVIMSSKILHDLYSIYKCQATIIGFSLVPDLKAIIDYISDAVENINPALKIPANNMDLNDGAVLGLKGKKAQDRYDLSRLSVLNLEGGNTKKGTQKTAAGTPDSVSFDECSKGDIIAPWNAAVPSFAGGPKGKWRVTPLLSACVCVGTKVYKSDGTISNIEEITKEDELLGYDGEGYSIENIPWIQSPKKKNCVSITTTHDKNIQCSDDHPLMVYEKGKTMFKKAGEIKSGDNVLFFNGLKPFGCKKIYHAELIGLMIGDGYYGQGCELSVSDESLYKYISDKYYWHVGKSRDVHYNPYYRRVVIKGFTDLLRIHGMYGDTKMAKKLPVDIDTWDKESVAGLLRGYFEADGSISKEVNRRRISLSSVSVELIESVRMLLEKFGIVSNVFTSIKNSNARIYSNVNKKEGIIGGEELRYSLEITRYEFVKRFYEEIGFISDIKKTRLANVINHAVKNINYVHDVPFNDVLPGKGMFFKGKNCNNISLLKVVSTEDIGLQPVYNLTAGNTNTYLTNGFISHNTAGEAELSQDAEKMLKNPETYKIMPMDYDILEEMVDPEYITWNRQQFGMFVPAQMSLEAPPKIVKSMSEFLGVEDNPKLDNLRIHTTDWKAAKEFFEAEQKIRANDIDVLASYKNSFPLDPEDCYITTEQNKFPGLQSKARKRYIEENGETGQRYRLHKDASGTIHAEMVNDPIIEDYPFKGGVFDAPVVMLENPLLGEEPPLGLYVLGFDDVRQSGKTDGDSVISATIYKRGFEGGEWADRFVAWYDSRPDRKQDYYKTLYLLVKIFNARILAENEDNGFLEWMETHHMDDVHIHFSTGVGLASEENLNLNKNRKFGWAPTALNIYRLEQKLVMYTKEDGIVINGIEDLTGVDRINHPMLLEEFYKYKKGQNADRIRSAGLALTLAQYYDKTYQYMKKRRRVIQQDETKKKKTWNTIFSDTKRLTKW